MKTETVLKTAKADWIKFTKFITYGTICSCIVTAAVVAIIYF